VPATPHELIAQDSINLRSSTHGAQYASEFAKALQTSDFKVTAAGLQLGLKHTQRRHSRLRRSLQEWRRPGEALHCLNCLDGDRRAILSLGHLIVFFRGSVVVSDTSRIFSKWQGAILTASASCAKNLLASRIIRIPDLFFQHALASGDGASPFGYHQPIHFSIPQGI
jgi:hypothetical protein